MSLESAVELLAHAQRHRYAVGYFESWDLASLEGVIDAAEQSRSPVIIGFNGEFLARPDRAMPTRLAWYAALGRAAAESAKVPCALIFNECPVDSWVREAVQAGFNIVMLADAEASHADLTRRIADLATFAHSKGAAVEAELGTLPCGDGQHASAASSITDPDQAVAFVRATGIDFLAVSVGNTHILLEGRCDINLPHLAAIRRKLDIPLVLHGGSGVSPDSLAQAIATGIAKVNYGTYLKQHSLTAIRNTLAERNTNPHNLLGDGGEADLVVVIRRTVRDATLDRIVQLGCCGRA